MSDFTAVFDELRRLVLEAAPGARAAVDAPGDLVLHSRDTDPRTGKPIWFGAVAVKRSYVAYHLFPLYEDPDLGTALSPELVRRRHGKSCFNFKTVEPPLFEALAELTRAAARARGLE